MRQKQLCQQTINAPTTNHKKYGARLAYHHIFPFVLYANICVCKYMQNAQKTIIEKALFLPYATLSVKGMFFSCKSFCNSPL